MRGKGIFSPKEDLNKPGGVLTPSVLVADVREPPDIAQIDGESHDGEEEIHLFAPLVPGVAVGVRGRRAGEGTQAGLLCHAATPANPAGFRLRELGAGKDFCVADDRSEEGRVRLTALPHLPLETHGTESRAVL